MKLYKFIFSNYASKSTIKQKPIPSTFDTIGEQGKYMNNQEIFRHSDQSSLK